MGFPKLAEVCPWLSGQALTWRRCPGASCEQLPTGATRADTAAPLGLHCLKDRVCFCNSHKRVYLENGILLVKPARRSCWSFYVVVQRADQIVTDPRLQPLWKRIHAMMCSNKYPPTLQESSVMFVRREKLSTCLQGCSCMSPALKIISNPLKAF